MTWRLWRKKWGLLRLLVAGFLLWVVATDTGARLARMQLAALPGFDYVQEVQSLRAQGRYGEAVMVADSGLADPDANQALLTLEKQKTVTEQSSFLTKAKGAGMGALTGQGDSLESLVGAIAADFFVVGDIRDLVVQGGKQMLDGDSDELVLLLSVVGVITTLAPEVDWVPSVLKAARKMGAVSSGMAEYLKSAIKGKRVAELEKVFGDVEKIAKKASPGGAARILKHVDDPKELERVARFVESSERGAFALHVAGKQGAEALKAGASGEVMLLKVARKGRAGMDFMRQPIAARLMRPHWVIGVVKAVWKGNAENVVARALERLDASAWWVLPLLAGWVVVELAMLLGRPAPVPRPPAARLRIEHG